MNGEEQNQQAVQSALQTGLKMLNSEAVSTPNAWNRDLAQLEQLMIGLLSGNLMIIPGPNAQPAGAGSSDGGKPPPPPPGDDGGSGKPN